MTSQTHPPATRPALLVGLAVALLALPAPSPAQDLCTDFSGQWGYGRIFEVEVRDGLAYYTQGADVVIADVSEPGAPVELGRVNLWEPLHGLALRSGVLYLGCAYNSLCIVDVSDPIRPALRARVPMAGGAFGIEIEGQYLLYQDDQRLSVVDVSEPGAPEVVSVLSVDGWDVAVSGDFAYVAQATSVTARGLHTIDVSDPFNPVEVDYQPMAGFRTVEVSGSYLYLGGSTPSLRIFDLADPAHPMEVGSCDPPGSVWEIDVADGMAVLAGDSGGLQVVDVSDPTAPASLGSYQVAGMHAYSVGMGPDRRVFLGTEFDGLRELVLDDPAHPQLVGLYVPPREATAVASAGDLVVVADAEAGIRLLDGASGPELRQLGQVETFYADLRVNDIALHGAHAYLAQEFVVDVVDIADPAAPSVVTTLDVYADLVTVVGDRAVVVKGALEVFDLSDPSAPSSLGPPCPLPDPSHHSTYPYATAMAANATHAYVDMYYQGWPLQPDNWANYVVDISDPADPVAVLLPDLAFLGAALHGQYLYAAQIDRITVYDVSDPLSPVEVGMVPAPPYASYFGRLEIEGDLLLAAEDEIESRGAMYVLDLSDPVHPMLVGDYRTAWPAPDVTVSNGRAYVTNGYAGVFALDVGACQTLFVDNLESGGTARWSVAVP